MHNFIYAHRHLIHTSSVICTRTNLGSQGSKTQTQVFYDNRGEACNPSFMLPVFIGLRKVNIFFSNINKKDISLLIPINVFKADFFQNTNILEDYIKQLCMSGKLVNLP